MTDVQVEFASYSLRSGDKNGMAWYEWCVFASGPAGAIDQIDEVRYVLHPSFPNPERVVRDRAGLFALYSAGWGSFGIEIKIVFKDSRSSWQDFALMLYEDDWPKREAEGPLDAATQAVYDSLDHDRYRWRKLTSIAAAAGLGVDEAQVILEQLAEANLARAAYFRAPDGVALWGSTAILGISPELDRD